MAIYNYKCADCGNVFAVKATIEEKEGGTSEKFQCPKCGSKNAKHEFSLANFVKNIFSGGDEAGACCSGDKCCGSDNSEKDQKNSHCCSGDNSEVDCCSRK